MYQGCGVVIVVGLRPLVVVFVCVVQVLAFQEDLEAVKLYYHFVEYLFT